MKYKGWNIINGHFPGYYEAYHDDHELYITAKSVEEVKQEIDEL